MFLIPSYRDKLPNLQTSFPNHKRHKELSQKKYQVLRTKYELTAIRSDTERSEVLYRGRQWDYASMKTSFQPQKAQSAQRYFTKAVRSIKNQTQENCYPE